MKFPRLKQKRYQHVNIIELETFLIKDLEKNILKCYNYVCQVL